jgi:hypothetical protein
MAHTTYSQQESIQVIYYRCDAASDIDDNNEDDINDDDDHNNIILLNIFV